MNIQNKLPHSGQSVCVCGCVYYAMAFIGARRAEAAREATSIFFFKSIVITLSSAIDLENGLAYCVLRVLVCGVSALARLRFIRGTESVPVCAR